MFPSPEFSGGVEVLLTLLLRINRLCLLLILISDHTTQEGGLLAFLDFLLFKTLFPCARGKGQVVRNRGVKDTTKKKKPHKINQ